MFTLQNGIKGPLLSRSSSQARFTLKTISLPELWITFGMMMAIILLRNKNCLTYDVKHKMAGHISSNFDSAETIAYGL